MDYDGKWTEETDVIVVGYGLSGAIAAIEAHDNGAEVVILEKSQYPGGCSILSQGVFLCAHNAKTAAEYLIKTSAGRVDENLIYTFAQDLTENEEYVRNLAQSCDATVKTIKMAEPGGDKSGYLPGYPFPGIETFYRAVITQVPGFEGFPWVQKLGAAGAKMMKVAMDNVKKRSINVRLSTPAKRLVQNDEDYVIGLTADKNGEDIALRARRSVILASGGFEQNRWMVKQYLQGTPFYSMGPLTHTGDGILMAQKAGAALWHMWHIHGSYGFKYDEFPIAFRTTLSGPRSIKRTVPWIAVDKFGRRYMNEYQPFAQDTGHRAMEIIDPDMPGYSRIPSYLIFDETGRKFGPIAQPLSLGGSIYDWSRDNSKEIAKGWILQAENIEELAFKINETEDNEARMDSSILKTTISRWNDFVKTGEDPLQRPSSTMMSISVPPFYAAAVWPMITNTQGGPVHNAKQQVIDAFGQPIPRLYAVGELGSFWSNLYLLDGNLGECFSSGRIAGRNAALERVREKENDKGN